MTQITIRRLDPLVVEGLRKRATSAGHSMEEEVRNILSETVLDAAIERQRLGLKRLEATRKAIFGNRVLPDSSGEIRRMRDERTRHLANLASPRRRKHGM